MGDFSIYNGIESMSTFDYLRDHAIKEVWCSPRQDKSFILRPRRMTPAGGDVVRVELDMLNVWLPNNDDYFHVYQIGNLHPDYMGLFPVMGEWVSMADVSNMQNMLATAYNQNGQMYPRYDTWYMVTRSRNLIVAIKQQKYPGVNFFDDEIFFRVYTNAYFQSVRSNHITLLTDYKGQAIDNEEDVLAMQAALAEMKQKVGYAYALINGYFYEEITPFNAKVGDAVEIIYDSSVYRVVEFPIKKLTQFDSTLDNHGKFLLHYPMAGTRIDYQDEVDVFLIDRKAAIPNGVYVHKNNKAALRMVTHKDYSLHIQAVQSTVSGHPNWTQMDDLNVLLLIRNGGFDRELVFENNRIHELYKLPTNDIIKAMTGIDSAMPNWRAENLEASAYTQIMREKLKNITRPLVQEAYGYNAMSKLLGDSPLLAAEQNGILGVDVPRGLYENSTAYEYNANGLLLGWYYHEVGTFYPCTHSQTKYVEMVSGKAAEWIDEVYDQKVQTLDPNLNYRMYVCDVISGIPQNNWKDVTNTGMYAVVGNELTWIINMSRYRTLVRSDKQVYSKIFTRKFDKGCIEFDLTKLLKIQDTYTIMTQDVPLGELDIWLNSHSLIEKLDYFVQWPKVVIVNKQFIDQKANEEEQEIAIRFAGFCKEDLTREIPEDIGFVKYELLSRNAVFNIRDDRVLRIVAGGRIYDRSDLKFSEDDQAYLLPNAKNGLPYYIRDQVVPMRGLTDGDTYSMREESRIIDQRVSDYLSLKLPEETVTQPNVINERWMLYSPFLGRVLMALLNNEIDIELIKDHYEPADIKRWCAPYEYLLAFDPTQDENKPDIRYVNIHPHYRNDSVGVDIYHYKFMEMVITLYMADLRSMVQLSQFLHLNPIT